MRDCGQDFHRDSAPVTQQNSLKPWRQKTGAFPPKENADCVYAMEDVRDVDCREYDDNTVLVCLYEASWNRRLKPVHPYRFVRINRRATMTNRNGTAHFFMLSAPGLGWRHVKVADRRTKQDCAHVLKDLADGHCPEKNIVVVMDNLNTHKLSTLYGTFKPTEARRLTRRFEVHHSLKHGSWLNMAAIAINVLTHQCQARCNPGRETMESETKAWADYRNETAKPIDWQFRTEDVRIKLKSLYPSTQ